MNRWFWIGICVVQSIFAGLSAGQRVDWKISQGKAFVKNNQTVLPISVEFLNGTAERRTLSVEVKVVDYFQQVLDDRSLTISLEASKKKSVYLPVTTDHAGPYLKLIIKGSENGGAAPLSIDDEQLVFTEVVTGPRMRLCLNGEWQMCPDESVNLKKIPTGPWEACELPYRWLTWGGTHTRWFRKQFILPVEMKGKNIELQLSGVRFRADVFLNGQFVKKNNTDQMPFYVNLARLAKPGEKNEIIIAVTDWLSCVAPELQGNLKGVWSSAWLQGREIPGSPFIRPCTMGIGAAGVSDPIYIIATSDLAIEACRISPSVRKSQLAVHTTIVNHTPSSRDVILRLMVFSQDVDIPITTKPGRNEVEKTLTIDQSKIKLWWPWKPSLNRLQAEIVQNNQVLDRLDTRFGFREFWADGPVFRINNVPIKPNAAAGIPFDFPGLANYDEQSRIKYWHQEKKFLRSFSNINVNLVRYHSEPYPILMFDLADELGLMVVSEAYMATLPGKLKMDDIRLWNAMAEFYPKWVYREWNHPSLVIRSMENELGYHLPTADQPRSPWGYPDKTIQLIVRKMKEMGWLVKSIDPSRLIMYEGSGPIFYDVADVYNIHYPGIRGGGDLYPITGRRLSIPAESYFLKEWLWDRKKPLYVGEYDCCFGEPKHFASLLGNAAYAYGFLHLAHDATWNYSIPGQRIDGMTSGVPWTILTFNDVGLELSESNSKIRRFKELTTPIASFIHQYREGYFGGREISRTITTLNDTLESQAIKLRWTLSNEDGKVFHEEETDMTLTPAGSRLTQIKLMLPVVNEPVTYQFNIETIVGKDVTHRDSRKLRVYPDQLTSVKTTSRIGTIGLSDDVFKSLNLSYKAMNVDSLDLANIDVLLVSGDVTGLEKQSAQINKFIRRGGRLVILNGSRSPDYLPFKLTIAPGSAPIHYKSDTQPAVSLTIPSPDSTMTIVHPLIPDHPLLKGLDSDLLRFWREDHLTAMYTYQRPQDVFVRFVLGCGQGLQQTSLMEIPYGKGLVVVMQMPVLETYSDQPAARILLVNLLNYVDSFRNENIRSVVGVLVNPKSSIPDFLKSIRIEPYSLSNQLDKVKTLADYNVLLIDLDASIYDELKRNKQKLNDYVAAGGVVWIHKPSPEDLNRLNEILPQPVAIQKLDLKAPIHVLGQGLLAGLSNDEVFWPEGNFLPNVSPRVAQYSLKAMGSQIMSLADPAVAMTIKSGQGKWFIDEISWENEFAERTKAQRLVRAILLNLGLQIYDTAALPVKTLDSSLGYKSIDISRFCNEGFQGGIWNGPNQGLLKLPVGMQTFQGIPFHVIDPLSSKKSCISFYSGERNITGVKKIDVPVDRRMTCLHLLLTSAWTSSLPAMTSILKIEIKYEDNTIGQADVCYGRDVLDWCPPDLSSTRTHPAVVWVGTEWPNPGLYDFVWINPCPEKKIKAVSLLPNNETGFVVVLAMTTQERLSEKQKKISDWIPGLER